MAETTHYHLYTSSDEQAKFKEWRENVAGETNSNMTKIDNALKEHDDAIVEKQDKLAGTTGQIVGFNDEGEAIPQDASEIGVISFNGRKGAVSPRSGDYTAGDVDAIPASQKGTAGGVASLDGSGKVPASQLPDMDYIPTAQKGAAGGVASLGEDGKVPEAMLPVQGGLVAQATAPSNTKLGWIDTGHGNILKYYNGSAWTSIGSVWG